MAYKAKRLIVVAGALLIPVLTGCNNDAPPLTPKEQADFKGGPMPPEAREIMQQRMKEAREKAAQGRGGAGGASGAPGAPVSPPGPGK